MNNTTEVFTLELEQIKIHYEVAKFIKPKNADHIEFTMKQFGQQMPILGNFVDDIFYITDGVIRFQVARKLEFKTLKCLNVNLPDDEVIKLRMSSNQKTKMSYSEMAECSEVILGTIGISQGKKRESLGFSDFQNDQNYGTIGLDRFELTCHLLGLSIKASSLRKLMAIKWDEKWSEILFNGLDDGKISLEKAYKIYKKKKKTSLNEAERLKNDLEGKKNGVYYKLYNKSSMVMDEILNDSVTLFIDSHPYFQLRDYRNQDSLKHGQEKTVKEYVANFVDFCREKKKKLKPGGVMVTVIGETYLNGYKNVCSRVEVALEDDGWELIDCNIWEKSNPKYTPHPLRFLNSYERIIVARKPNGETYFQEQQRLSSTGKIEYKSTTSGDFYLTSENSCITNVIKTNVYNPSELKAIDPDFNHDAPCQSKIYETFIKTYSKPGDLIVDGFVGAGTVSIGLTLGSNVIGYDVDPKSIEFSHKKFEECLKKREDANLEIFQAA